MANEFTPIVDVRDEDERKEKIKQLQKYLREIAKVDNRIPLLVIDGFFLDETENAVRIFQEIYGFTPNGEVDEQTFNKIYEEYINIVGVPVPCNCFNPFSETDSVYSVYFVQIMLKRLSEKYQNFPEIEINGSIDENTKGALEEIKRVHNLDVNAEKGDVFSAVLTIYCSVFKV
ncbi:MAG: peptidoglycan-binding protein [Clostridia bacterium]|nr:peptidoglycan-binding protein [Clostridia bacterium]